MDLEEIEARAKRRGLWVEGGDYPALCAALREAWKERDEARGLVVEGHDLAEAENDRDPAWETFADRVKAAVKRWREEK